MEYEVKTLNEFSVMGFSLRADNTKKGVEQIAKHWQRFWGENRLKEIPNRSGKRVIGLYSHYQSDGSEPFTLICGTRVSKIKDIPEEMVARNIPAQKYAVFTVAEVSHRGIIDNWKKINDLDLNRTYLADFEMYNKKHDKKPSDVKIYVGIE